jgi:hypothetical protein
MMDANESTPGMRALADFRREIGNLDRSSMDIVALERQVRELVKAVACETMGEVMQHADETAPEVVINGARWGNRRSTKASYETLFGTIELTRGTYQQAGRGHVAVPMDLRLGIIEGRYTPTTARVMSRAVGLMTAEEAEGLLGEVGLAQVSVSTLHRIPRAMAARHEQRRDTIDAAVREQEVIPTDAATVQAALDGVMVPQDGEHTRARGRKTEEPAPARHEARYGPVGMDAPAANDGKLGRPWHEASVGTLAFYDAEGRHLRTIYLGRMPEVRKATLVGQLDKELSTVLAERPELNICFASDGALTNWDALEGIAAKLPATACGTRIFLVDLYHVAGYLGTAAGIVAGEGTPEAKALTSQWRETMRLFDDGTHRVLKTLRYHRDQQTTESKREALQDVIDFIANQALHKRTQFAQALDQHFPVGTGVTEAAAKTLVNVRMKRAGSRFSQHGGQTVLLFRSAILSERFDALSRELERTYTATVEAA